MAKRRIASLTLLLMVACTNAQQQPPQRPQEHAAVLNQEQVPKDQPQLQAGDHQAQKRVDSQRCA